MQTTGHKEQTMGEYATYYEAGREAGNEYPWPEQWSGMFTDGPSGLRRVSGHGTMAPAAVAGWMRGFRHACMDRVLPRRCPDCGVFTFNAEHICVEYDACHPCPECSAPSVFVFVAAPGTGIGWECKNGHYSGTCRELTLDDVR